jgi:hypothetical protein
MGRTALAGAAAAPARIMVVSPPGCRPSQLRPNGATARQDAGSRLAQLMKKLLAITLLAIPTVSFAGMFYGGNKLNQWAEAHERVTEKRAGPDD